MLVRGKGFTLNFANLLKGYSLNIDNLFRGVSPRRAAAPAAGAWILQEATFTMRNSHFSDLGVRGSP